MVHRKQGCLSKTTLVMGLLVLSHSALRAGTPEPPLQNRIEQLEKQVAELQKAAASAPAGPAAPQELPARKGLWSNLDVQLYGYVKGDASYDSSRTTSGNFVLYVDSEATRDSDNEFNLTANQTRLGLNIGGPESETMRASGKVEFDFYGNYASENKSKIQMRHAYMTLLWPQWDLTVIAGQTSDVVSPLVPTTLNYTVLWDAGNIGYRRPQIRLTKGLPLGEKTALKFEGAMARTIGRTTPADPTLTESGEDAGFPTLQGRVSMAFPFVGPKPAAVGISGHYGQEEYDLDATGRHVDFDTRSVCLDVTVPVAKWLTLQGELFSGENLDSYFGGIGQGVNTTAREEIRSQGGWIAATLGPWSKCAFNVGAGIDDVEAEDVDAGARTLNSSVFGNVIYSWNKHAQVGFEMSHWKTRYKGSGDADDMRAQVSFIYTF